MSEHTPGPWEVLPASNYIGYAIAPRGTLPTLAAVERPVGARDTINIHAFNFPGETLANAHLIAAAPDGLVVAEQAYMALLRFPIESDFRIENQILYAMLRNYIAKATGRSAESVQDEFEAKARGEAAP